MVESGHVVSVEKNGRSGDVGMCRWLSIHNEYSLWKLRYEGEANEYR